MSLPPRRQEDWGLSEILKQEVRLGDFHPVGKAWSVEDRSNFVVPQLGLPYSHFWIMQDQGQPLTKCCKNTCIQVPQTTKTQARLPRHHRRVSNPGGWGKGIIVFLQQNRKQLCQGIRSAPEQETEVAWGHDCSQWHRSGARESHLEDSWGWERQRELHKLFPEDSGDNCWNRNLVQAGSSKSVQNLHY